MFCVVLLPQVIDTALLAIFLIYGSALFLGLRHGGDSLITTRLGSDNIPLRIWQLIAGSLLVSGLGEIGISLVYATGHGARQPTIVSGLSSIVLVGLGILGLSPHLSPPSPRRPKIPLSRQPKRARN